MIPLRAQERIGTRPFVTWAITVVCSALLIRLAVLGRVAGAGIHNSLGVVPARFLASPGSPTEWLTLLTSAFLHAGWVHLVGNLLYLLVFAPVVEDRLGHARFALLYVAAGLVGALAHVVVNPASQLPLVGASGAIAGVLGAHLVLEPRSRILTAIPVVVFIELATLPAAFVIALWVLLQAASALAPVAVGADYTIAWWAHLGGFATGIALCGPQALTRASRSLFRRRR